MSCVYKKRLLVTLVSACQQGYETQSVDCPTEGTTWTGSFPLLDLFAERVRREELEPGRQASTGALRLSTTFHPLFRSLNKFHKERALRKKVRSEACSTTYNNLNRPCSEEEPNTK